MKREFCLLVREVLLGNARGGTPVRITQVAKVRIEWPEEIPDIPPSGTAGEWCLVEQNSLWKMRSAKENARDAAKLRKRISEVYGLEVATTKPS